MNASKIFSSKMIKTIKKIPYVSPRSKYVRVKIGALIRKCAGGAHAWYASNVGPVRKPII